MISPHGMTNKLKNEKKMPMKKPNKKLILIKINFLANKEIFKCNQ